MLREFYMAYPPRTGLIGRAHGLCSCSRADARRVPLLTVLLVFSITGCQSAPVCNGVSRDTLRELSVRTTERFFDLGARGDTIRLKSVASEPVVSRIAEYHRAGALEPLRAAAGEARIHDVAVNACGTRLLFDYSIGGEAYTGMADLEYRDSSTRIVDLKLLIEQ